MTNAIMICLGTENISINIIFVFSVIICNDFYTIIFESKENGKNSGIDTIKHHT